MNLNIEYEHALDFEHIDTINDARDKLSQLTNLLNKMITARQQAKTSIINQFSAFPEVQFHKLSWDNKLIALMYASKADESISFDVQLWQEADTAYKKIKNKQNQVTEDLMALKKMIDVTPR